MLVEKQTTQKIGSSQTCGCGHIRFGYAHDPGHCTSKGYNCNRFRDAEAGTKIMDSIADDGSVLFPEEFGSA